TYPLPENFSLFATQNPRGQLGTYPLPESQLDRFLFKFSMGHLTENEEVELLISGSRDEFLSEISPLVERDELKEVSLAMKNIKTSKNLLHYVVEVLQKSRKTQGIFGLSPRAGLDIVDAARGWAYFEGRDYVIPDDVQAIFPYVAGHRMFFSNSFSSEEETHKAMDFIKTINFISA